MQFRKEVYLIASTLKYPKNFQNKFLVIILLKEDSNSQWDKIAKAGAVIVRPISDYKCLSNWLGRIVGVLHKFLISMVPETNSQEHTMSY